MSSLLWGVQQAGVQAGWLLPEPYRVLAVGCVWHSRCSSQLYIKPQRVFSSMFFTCAPLVRNINLFVASWERESACKKHSALSPTWGPPLPGQGPQQCCLLPSAVTLQSPPLEVLPAQSQRLAPCSAPLLGVGTKLWQGYSRDPQQLLRHPELPASASTTKMWILCWNVAQEVLQQ